MHVRFCTYCAVIGDGVHRCGKMYWKLHLPSLVLEDLFPGGWFEHIDESKGRHWILEVIFEPGIEFLS